LTPTGAAPWRRVITVSVNFPTRNASRPSGTSEQPKANPMSQIVYIVGAIVIVLAILSFVGLA